MSFSELQAILPASRIKKILKPTFILNFKYLEQSRKEEDKY